MFSPLQYEEVSSSSFDHQAGGGGVGGGVDYQGGYPDALQLAYPQELQVCSNVHHSSIDKTLNN